MKITILFFSILFFCSCQQNTHSVKKRYTASSQEILYFGDSQAVLWLGPVIGSYFSQIKQICDASGKSLPRSFGSHTNFTGYATGSSAFKHWIATSGNNYEHICGSKKHSALIGNQQKRGGLSFNRSAPHVCQEDSPVDAIFNEHPSPSLVVINFLGNAAWDSIRQKGKRVVPSSDWGFNLKNKYKNQVFDLSLQVREFISKIPNKVPCLVLTTTPNRLKSSVQLQRIHAQAVIEAEVNRSGRCSFVRGITEDINNTFARRPEFHGDSYHVSTAGGEWWLDQLTPNICRAIKTATRMAR